MTDTASTTDTDKPSSSASPASPSGSSPSSSPRGLAAAKGVSWATLAAVGVVSYAWLFTRKMDGWAWWGVAVFYAAAVLPGDVVQGLGTAALDRLLPRRPPDGK